MEIVLGTTRRGAAASKSSPIVADRVVDTLVNDLNQLKTKSSLEMSLKMGKLIVECIYGSDLSIWRQHLAKETSFRKLAARTKRDLRVSATFLYRAVALYELTCRIGTREASGLTMTHFRAVLGLPEHDQTTLLEAAEANGWSTERLEREATAVRATLLQRKGRPASPALTKAVRKLVGACTVVEAALSQKNAGALSQDELESIYRAVDEIKTRLEKAARSLVGLHGRTGAHLEA